jgi:hypothetical protein
MQVTVHTRPSRVSFGTRSGSRESKPGSGAEARMIAEELSISLGYCMYDVRMLYCGALVSNPRHHWRIYASVIDQDMRSGEVEDYSYQKEQNKWRRRRSGWVDTAVLLMMTRQECSTY